jgi:hypothetical protein
MADQSAHLPDGPRDEGTRTFLGGARIPLYAEVWRQADSLAPPMFLHAGNPHERLFVAALDGTGNDFIHDPQHATNIGLIYDQLHKSPDGRIAAKYVEGTGTQAQWLARVTDGARGYTADERAEQMYKMFIDQAGQWIQEDPYARIGIVSVGFSRGGEEVALFARLVAERGIQDPAGAHYTYDAHGLIEHVGYSEPVLVGPGKTAQAVALFDPVGTGQPLHEDRRLPPSVISGIQLNAMDEHRRLFKSDHIIDPGITVDGRFAGFNLPGAHCDIGGSYLLNGLSNRAGNVAVAYLNALSDRRYLQPLPEFDDPQRNVVHRSEDGMFLYGADYKVDRATPDGYNDVLVDQRLATRLSDARNAEPRDEALNARFEHQTIAHAMQNPVFEAPPPVAESPSELDRLIARLYQAALHHEPTAMDAAAADYLRTQPGQAWQQQAFGAVPALQIPDLASPTRPLPLALQDGTAQQVEARPAPVM